MRDEVVYAGGRYVDANAARQRIQAGEIAVAPAPTDNISAALIAPYNLGIGETECILLAGHPEWRDATLVIDDHLAYLVSDRLGRRKRFLLDVFLDLVKSSTLDVSLAVSIVLAVRPRYPGAFVEHTLLVLRG